MPRRSCQGTNAEGEPCGSPIVDEEGWCPAHRPDGSARMAEIGRKGAESTARRFKRDGLSEDELPPLESHEAAETWCEVVGRAVVVGRIGHREAKAALSAVSEWRESRQKGAETDRIDDLMDALGEWRRTGDPAPVLELVDS